MNAIQHISPYAAPGIKLLNRPTLEVIEHQVCSYYRVPTNVVYTRTRRFDLVKVRRAIFLIGRYYGYSLPLLGRRAKLNHVSVYHNSVRLLNELEVMPAVRRDFEALCQQMEIDAQQILQRKRFDQTSL
ncbi:MAG: hypothetical protein IPM52_13325 [Bacteroidetes bacterium]|nr:hypothetical protein [Bacteroidota bacterium]